MQAALQLWNGLGPVEKYATTTAVALPLLYAARKYYAGGVNIHRPDLSGKVVLITGANTGIGLETAKYLAKLNAEVFVTVRDDDKGRETVRSIKEGIRNIKVDYFTLELSRLQNVRDFVEEWKRRTGNKKIDIFIANAGVMLPPYTKTADGFELQFGVNHLAHFLLTNLLLKNNLINENGGRIIIVASRAHKRTTKNGINFDDLNWERGYHKMHAYGQSKLANILFAKELDRRMKSQGKNITAVSLHPGVVATELARHVLSGTMVHALFFLRFFFKTPYQGAQTTIHCALAPEVSQQGGEYFSDCKVTKPVANGLDMEKAAKLWEVSQKLVARLLNVTQMLQFSSLLIHEGEHPTIGLEEDQPVFSDSNLIRLKERMESYMEARGTRGKFKIPEVKQLVKAFPQENVDLAIALPENVPVLDVKLSPQIVERSIALYKDHAAREAKKRAQEKKKKKQTKKQTSKDIDAVLKHIEEQAAVGPSTSTKSMDSELLVAQIQASNSNENASSAEVDETEPTLVYVNINIPQSFPDTLVTERDSDHKEDHPEMPNIPQQETNKEADYKAFMDALNTWKNDRKAWETKLDQSEKDRKALETKFEQSEKDRKALETKFEQSEKDRKALETKFEQSEKDRKALETKFEQSEKDRKALETKFEQSEKDRKALETKFEKDREGWEKEKEELVERITQLENVILNQNVIIADANVDHIALRSIFEALRRRLFDHAGIVPSEYENKYSVASSNRQQLATAFSDLYGAEIGEWELDLLCKPYKLGNAAAHRLPNEALAIRALHRYDSDEYKKDNVTMAAKIFTALYNKPHTPYILH